MKNPAANINMLLTLGLVGGVGFIAWRLFGTAKDPLVKLAAAELKKLESEGIRPNRTAAGWRAVADGIYQSVRFSAIDDNKAQAETYLKAPLNAADVYALIVQYGTRQRAVFGLPDGPATNLAATIYDELDTAAINRINAFYQTRNINYRW